MKNSIFYSHRAFALVPAFIAASIFSMLVGAPAEASDRNDIDIHSMLKRSSLVIEGEVIEIKYRNSKADQTNPNGQPFTFVTYKIANQIRGQAEGVFTLRFYGGANQDGTVMAVGNYPNFDIGDRDVLMVKGNNENGCPLVDCENGRFRILSERIYSENGRSILPQSNGKGVNFGAAQELKSILTHTIVHPKTGEAVTVETRGAVLPAVPPEANQFKRDGFLTFLRKAVQTLPPPSGSEKTADINFEFSGYVLRAVSPRPFPAIPPTRPGSPSDADEVRAFEANNGNPVLPL